MAVVSDLPLEVLQIPLRLLDKKSLKSLRLVSKALSDIATPYCFETVKFDLVEVLPLKNLINISQHEKLRGYVKHLVLQRMYGLRYNPANHEETFNLRFLSDSERYSKLSKNKQKCLLKDYDAEYEYSRKQARQISRHMQFRSLGCRGCIEKLQAANREKVPMTLYDELLQSFDEAILAFSNLRNFSHKPAYKHNADWGLTWRDFRFDSCELYYHSDRYEDQDVESLQLSIVLRALGWANYFGRNLQSLTLDMMGPGFWSAERLKWLWQGHEDLAFRQSDHKCGTFKRIPHGDDLSQREMYHYHEQLSVMKHAFTYLHHLDILVGIRDEDGETMKNVNHRVFDFLRQCEMLGSLRLCISLIEDYTSEFSRDKLSVKPLLDRLTMARPWQRITQLELQLYSDEETIINFLSSVAETLQKLTLYRLRIYPEGGSLESLLIRVGKTLTKLKELQLSELRDELERQEYRLILRDWSVVWRLDIDIYAEDDQYYFNEIMDEDETESEWFYRPDIERTDFEFNPCYAHYKSAIINAVLNRADILPELGPIAFLREHQRHCAK